MNYVKVTLAVLWIPCWFVENGIGKATNTFEYEPLLIVTSFDGLGSTIVNKSWTPNLMNLRPKGSYSKYLQNVFPTKTLVNHFSIATGLYSQYHGVMGNGFYDPALGKVLHYGPEMFSYSNSTVPIWTLNELAGPNRYSGCYMWPGCDFPYRNTSATFMQPYREKRDFKNDVDIALSWVTHKTKPVNLLMLYFDEPDFHGHAFGVSAPEYKQQVTRVDEISAYLDQRLTELRLDERAHVIHLSDHGMEDIPLANVINVTKYLTPHTYTFAEKSPSLHVIPKPGEEKNVYNQLVKAQKNEKHFQVLTKESMPERWKFNKCSRTPPILLLCDRHYILDDFNASDDFYVRKFNRTVKPTNIYGSHGFDNTIVDMHAFFMARGPKIKVNFEVNPFEVVDLYALFANILELKPIEKVNSTFARVGPMLRLEYARDNSIPAIKLAMTNEQGQGTWGTLFIVLLACVVAMLGVGSMVTWMMRQRQNTENIPITYRRHQEDEPAINSGGEIQGLLLSDSASDND